MANKKPPAQIRAGKKRPAGFPPVCKGIKRAADYCLSMAAFGFANMSVPFGAR